MSEVCTLVQALRRPKLLIRAARFGLAEYRRERDLRRLVVSPASSEDMLLQLLETEHRMEDIRKTGGAAYCVARHIEVLVALLAEARLVQRQT